MTPSASVHISTTSAPRHAANSVAVRSEPPRPNVVVRPRVSAPINPVTTGISPAARSVSRISSARPVVAVVSYRALPKLSSVTIMSRPSAATAFKPTCRRYPETITADTRSP